jgi:23S rRNA pseudouridine1911/1915/1917 synthase
MHSIGHPLIGDPVYGSARLERALPEAVHDFGRQALHAARLALIHPATGAAIAFESPLPADLQALLAMLEQHG